MITEERKILVKPLLAFIVGFMYEANFAGQDDRDCAPNRERSPPENEERFQPVRPQYVEGVIVSERNAIIYTLGIHGQKEGRADC
jgi:hypothetical protein